MKHKKCDGGNVVAICSGFKKSDLLDDGTVDDKSAIDESWDIDAYECESCGVLWRTEKDMLSDCEPEGDR